MFIVSCVLFGVWVSFFVWNVCLLLRNAYIWLGNNKDNSKTKNTLIKLFKSFIKSVLNNFSKIFSIFLFMLFIRYLVIRCFDIDLTRSLFDYIMFVTNIYVVSIWFGDKIFILSSKAEKVDWGFRTDYILSCSSPKSLLYLGFISLVYYFIVIPYFLPLVLVPLIHLFNNTMEDVISRHLYVLCDDGTNPTNNS